MPHGQAIYTSAGRHCCSVFGPPSGRRKGDIELQLNSTEFCVDHFPAGSFHSSWNQSTNPSSKHLLYGATPSLHVAAALPPVPRTATLRSAPQPAPRKPSSSMRMGGALRPIESLQQKGPAGTASSLRPLPADRSPAVTPASRRYFITSTNSAERLVKNRAGKVAAAKADEDRQQRLATRHEITDRVDCSEECLATTPVFGGGLDSPCSCRQVLDPAGLRQLPAHAMKSTLGVEEWEQLTTLYDLLDATGKVRHRVSRVLLVRVCVAATCTSASPRHLRPVCGVPVCRARMLTTCLPAFVLPRR